jgi:hypothetical protein
VILKTLLPEDPTCYLKIQVGHRIVQVPGSAQLEMLLVADDANAAYSNPRPLPKRADSPAVYSYTLPHTPVSGRRCTFDPKN